MFQCAFTAYPIGRPRAGLIPAMPAITGRRLLIALLLAAGACCALLLALLYPLIRAKADWGGSPDKQTLGSTRFIEQRAMTQYCTGVVSTPQATWLVGRVERSSEELPEASGLPDLSELVYGPREKGAAETSGPNPISTMLGLRDEPQTSIISRRNDKGQFEAIAMLPEAACLRATPDGKRVFLLTGLKRPEPADNSGPTNNQFVIFVSDDQGQHWQWLRPGLFPAAGFIAWNLDLYFFDSQSLWAWKDGDNAGTMEDGASSGAPTLLHSADGGATVEEIRSDKPLLVSFTEIRQRRNADTDWGDANGEFGDVKHHILQLDAEHAVAWFSQTFRYSTNGTTLNQHISLSTRVNLHRQNGHWQFEAPQSIPDLAIDEIRDNHAGQVVALLADKQGDMQLAILNRQTLAWETRSKVPGAFTPIPSGQALRLLEIGQHSVVINVMSDVTIPGVLALDGREHSISADAVFYTADWGKSWHKLAIDGYLGVLGMDAAHDRVIWAKGNWYSSRDLDIYSYGLH